MSDKARMRRFVDYRQAIGLLKDPNLVWSGDFEAIREDLYRFLEQSLSLGWDHNASLHNIVKRLIAEENDLSI